MKKRMLAFLAAAVMFVCLFSCANNGKINLDSALSNGSLFIEPVTISIMLPQNDVPFRDDWKAWEYIETATGADLDLRVTSTDYETKLSMILALPETIPDLIAFDSKTRMDSYASNGILIAVEDIEEQMPNWKRFWGKVALDKKAQLFKIRRSADGKIYWPARYGVSDICGLNTWIYRRDIFEQHGLDVPTTYDEMYEVAKKLKELYPDSYPISCENFFEHIAQGVGPQWRPNFEYTAYYDFEKNTWHYGAVEDTMLDMITVFKRFYDEGLFMPASISIRDSEFSELVTSSQTFMFPHFQENMSGYQAAMRNISTSFELAPMAPPVANDLGGTRHMTNYRIDSSGLSISNSRDQARIANAIKLFDWFYSDKATELLSWGKKDETYQVSGGNKYFILDYGEDIKSKYGFQTHAAGQVLHPAAVIAHYMAGTSFEDAETMLSSVESDCNPQKWLSLTAEEQAVVSTLGAEIDRYVQDMITKFLLGQKPLYEWGSFVESVNEMGVGELLSVYETAYNRVK